MAPAKHSPGIGHFRLWALLAHFHMNRSLYFERDPDPRIGTFFNRKPHAEDNQAMSCRIGLIKGSVNENVILSIANDRVIGLAICSAEQYKKIR